MWLGFKMWWSRETICSQISRKKIARREDIRAHMQEVQISVFSHFDVNLLTPQWAIGLHLMIFYYFFMRREFGITWITYGHIFWYNETLKNMQLNITRRLWLQMLFSARTLLHFSNNMVVLSVEVSHPRYDLCSRKSCSTKLDTWAFIFWVSTFKHPSRPKYTLYFVLQL